ncbi:MAG: hypothetical protein KF817_15145 [Phycisphaeraceae bacterium]|nr:hypothetical protein [Phycisphaeraceae bacterium]
MQRLELTDGLTLADLLARVAAGARLTLCRDTEPVAVIVRPDDLGAAWGEQEWARSLALIDDLLRETPALDPSVCMACGGQKKAP